MHLSDGASCLGCRVTPCGANRQDFFFCLPIIFGCPNKIKQEGDGTPYVCPRCHNAQVVQAKSRTWFELCWIPLVCWVVLC